MLIFLSLAGLITLIGIAMGVQTSQFANVSNSTNRSNFQPLEVVGRYRDPQLQVGENLNFLTWHIRVQTRFRQ